MMRGSLISLIDTLGQSLRPELTSHAHVAKSYFSSDLHIDFFSQFKGLVHPKIEILS